MSNDSPAPMPPDDPTANSGITWSVNVIENLALEAFWNNRGNWGEILEILNTAVKDLRPLAEQRPDGDNCPWPTCEGGACKPICPDQ